MGITFLIFDFLLLFCLAWSARERSIKNEEPSFEEKYTKLIPALLKSDVFKGLNLSEYENPDAARTYGADKFPCKISKCAKPATSVHRLRPCDIGVVSALGDSITAAFAAESSCLLTLFVEYRGISWSIGGEGTLETVLTLPNILKKYNAKVAGSPRVSTVPLITVPWEHLDVAVSGAISLDLPDQATTLVDKLKRNPSYDYANSWKVVTLFIGGNDLCGLCKNDKHTVEKYIGGIRDALDILHKSVPKMFVNLVLIMDVTRLNALNSFYCNILHRITCKCATTAGKAWQKKVSAQTLKYQAAVRDLINSGRYDTRDDFTVVIQPFLIGTTIPVLPDGRPDRSYFAPDCFHFSSKAHASAGLALWNNMVEPVGMKRKMWSISEKFECPREDFPYFFTRNNSEEYLKVIHPKKNVQSPQQDANTNGNWKEHSSSMILTALVSSVIAAMFLLTLIVHFVNLKSRRNAKEDCRDLMTPPYYGALG